MTTLPTLPEVIDWEELARLREREIVRLHDQINRTAAEHRRWERDMRAAARREIWGEVLRVAGDGVRSTVTREVHLLAAMVENLPAQLSGTKRRQLAEAARDVRAWLESVDTTEADSLLDEVRRLREVVRVQAHRLHADHGAPSGTGEHADMWKARDAEKFGAKR